MAKWVFIVLGVLLLAACNSGAATPTLNVRRTTATPTPTPLPIVATAVSAGAAANPLRLVIVPAQPADAAALETRLEERILKTTNVFVDIVLVTSYAEAVAAVCDTTSAVQSAAWLHPLAYAAANARNCGDAAFAWERAGQRAEAGLIVLNTTQATSIGGLADKPFCRLSAQDYYGWLLPLLLLRRAGLDPAVIGELVDYADAAALTDALSSGACAGAGLSAVAYDALPAAAKTNLTVALTSPELPLGLLMYPFQIPLGARLYLNDTLAALDSNPAALIPTPTPALATATPTPEGTPAPEATAEATPDPLAERYTSLWEPFLGAGAPARLMPEDLRELEAFLSSAGLDFAQLGN